MELKLTDQELRKLSTKKGLLALLSKTPLSIERSLRYVDYGKKLKKTSSRTHTFTNLGN